MAPSAFAGESRLQWRRLNGEGGGANERGSTRRDIPLGGATFDRTLFSGAIGEGGFLVEGGVNQAGHECIFLSDGRWEQSPPLAVDRILLSRFVWGAPYSPLQTCGTKQFVPMDKRIVSRRVELRDARLAKVFELYVAAHELTHVILEGFGAKGHFCRKRVHASWCPSQRTASASRCRRIEERTGKNRIRRASEAPGGGRWTVSVGWSHVDRMTAKSWDCGSGIDGDIDVGIWQGRRFDGRDILGDGRSIDVFGRVNHRRRASARTSRAALAYAARCSGGARGFRDVAVGKQETDQDGDVDNVGWARPILESLIDQPLQCWFS